jgi:8-oxo-dGTP pyrophosphatase MutT (NUDIX family)
MGVQNVELHRVTATAIIRKQGRCLIVKRSPGKKVFPGRWCLPGGGLETTDYIDKPKTTPDAWYFALENSLKREVREEANLEIDNLKYLLSLTFIRPDRIPVLTLSFYCDYKAGEVKLNGENTDYRWVDFKEAKNYDLIEGILEEIEMVEKIDKGRS